MLEQLAKTWKKMKKRERIFITFNRWYGNREKNKNLFSWYKNTQQYPKHNIIYKTDRKTFNLRDSNTGVFL